jgi:hypothetical protein
VVESQDLYDPSSELESLLRGAGKIVRPSEDLRPRVLENARLIRYERSMQSYLVRLALALTLLLVLTTSLRNPDDARPPQWPMSAQASASDSTEHAAGMGNESAWDAVDSFRALRRRQAELLRLAL